MLAEAKETFEKLCQMPPINNKPDVDAYWNFADARRLSPRQMACLRELYLWRERQAERQDVPRFKVLADSELVKIAKARPQDVRQLDRKRLISIGQADRYGKGIIRALEAGATAEVPHPPNPPTSESACHQALRQPQALAQSPCRKTRRGKRHHCTEPIVVDNRRIESKNAC